MNNKEEFRMEIFPLFEKEAMMFGMRMSSFYSLAASIALYISTPLFIGGFGIELGSYYYIGGIIAIIAYYIFLKSMGKKAHPAFAMAFLSHKLMQPKRITSMNFEFKLKSLKELKDENRTDE